MTRRLLTLAALCLALSCGNRPEPVAPAWSLTGDTSMLIADLDRLQAFTDTPAAAWAATVRDRLAACRTVSATAETPGALVEAIHCVDAAPPDGLAWMLGGPLGDGRIEARARLDGARTVVEIELTGEPADGPLAALLPRAADVGSPRFGGPLLVHGRFGADGGLDPASWVQEGTAGDRLFGLRDRLFSGALLTGVWEVAVPPPAEDEAMLPVVMAIETRSRTAAHAAVEAFVAELGRSWGLRPTPSRLDGDIEVDCFDDLRVLPAFQPCWLLVDDALVVGWNADALSRSLTSAEPASMDEPSRLVVHLDRFPAADATLGRATGAPPEALPGPYPWRRWTVEGRRDGDRYRVTVMLDPSAGE